MPYYSNNRAYRWRTLAMHPIVYVLTRVLCRQERQWGHQWTSTTSGSLGFCRRHHVCHSWWISSAATHGHRKESTQHSAMFRVPFLCPCVVVLPIHHEGQPTSPSFSLVRHVCACYFFCVNKLSSYSCRTSHCLVFALYRDNILYFFSHGSASHCSAQCTAAQQHNMFLHSINALNTGMGTRRNGTKCNNN